MNPIANHSKKNGGTRDRHLKPKLALKLALALAFKLKLKLALTPALKLKLALHFLRHEVWTAHQATLYESQKMHSEWPWVSHDNGDRIYPAHSVREPTAANSSRKLMAFYESPLGIQIGGLR